MKKTAPRARLSKGGRSGWAAGPPLWPTAYGLMAHRPQTLCQLLPQPARKPLVIIESPYSGDVERNEEYARACLEGSLRRGEAPIASHLLYTQMLDDRWPPERNMGIEAGLAWYRVAEKCVVYADLGMSRGMAEGVARARRHGVPIEYRNIEAWRAAA